MKGLLESAGHIVEIATTPDEITARQYGSTPPQAIVVKMARSSPFSISTIRSNSDVPIFVTLEEDLQSLANKYEKEGANQCFLPGFKMEELKSALRNI